MKKSCKPFRITQLVFLFLGYLVLNPTRLAAQELDSLLPVRGFAIAVPQPENLDRFIYFMENDLAKHGINTLILRVDYNYEYESYPNLRTEKALTKEDVKKLVNTAAKSNIRLIPQVNLLGHQSWAGTTGKLLEEYPKFDETPHIEMPEKYEWPNEDGLYCKSYCPLHPEVHTVVFALVDELMEVFEANAFHAGMDEVFYLGDEKCPRCGGKDKAGLFAGEIKTIRDHLNEKNQELWIWGDRLLDANSTGLGMWEASENGTAPAIDMIPIDVVICDWHYDHAEPTAAYFAMKGFRVISCSWNKPQVGKDQIAMAINFRSTSNKVLKSRFLGVMETIWSPADSFLDLYYEEKENPEAMGPVDCYKEMASTFDALKQFGESEK